MLSALSSWTQAGRAIYDLAKHVYRARELSREPLPMDALRFANEREASAMRFIDDRAVAVRATTDSTGALALAGNVKDGRHDLPFRRSGSTATDASCARRVHLQFLPAEQAPPRTLRAYARDQVPSGQVH